MLFEFEVRGERVEVDEGSKPASAGVSRPLRLGVILSSMEARDMRRKSDARALAYSKLNGRQCVV
jgi:hypothetical protein